jgi:hypothetical protein
MILFASDLFKLKVLFKKKKNLSVSLPGIILLACFFSTESQSEQEIAGAIADLRG